MSAKIQKGRAIQIGYQWRMDVLVKSKIMLFDEGARFAAQVRDNPLSDVTLAALTTENGGITRINSFTLRILVPASATAGMKPGKVFIDVARVDRDPPEHLGFRLEVPVRMPVTRLG